MGVKYTLWTYKLFIAVVGLMLLPSPRALAVGCCARCEPSSAVYHSPFFGYYPTCWRPWPGGQPPCPCYAAPQAAKPAAPTTPSEPAIEQLPAPRPEEPEKTTPEEQPEKK
jgi:hypothetical protein